MNYTDIDWSAETWFYIYDINGIAKFGITSNWDRRMKQYEKEVGDVQMILLKKEKYDNRWQAELIEQVVKWRLRPWAIEGRHEWIDKLPLQAILDCYVQTRDNLKAEFFKYQHIHLKGEHRFDHYKQIAKALFSYN